MRKIKEILRLKHACGFSKREIAQSCNVPRSTVGDYLMRARAACLDWSEASDLSDAQIESRLFPTEHLHSSVKRPAPDYHRKEKRRWGTFICPEFDTTGAFRAKFLKDDPFISRVSGFGSGEKAKKA